MIERISNQMLVLRPAQGRTEAKKNVSVKVSGEEAKPAEELYNPDFADKINSSRQSIRDELNLLKDTYQRPKVRQAENAEAEQSQESPEEGMGSYATLKRSMIRISSLLYQVASAAGGNSESLEQMQRRLVDELREYEGAYTRVDLDGVDPEELDLASKIDLDQLTPASAAEAQRAVEQAERALTNATSTLKSSESTPRSATEAALSTAEQNLAAAESAFYPEEIVDRAHMVSEALTRQMQDVTRAQGPVVPEDVLKLIGDA